MLLQSKIAAGNESNEIKAGQNFHGLLMWRETNQEECIRGVGSAQCLDWGADRVSSLFKYRKNLNGKVEFPVLLQQ